MDGQMDRVQWASEWSDMALCVKNLPVVKVAGDDELTMYSSEMGICTTMTYCMVVLPMALMATHVMLYVPSTAYVCVALSTSYEFVPVKNTNDIRLKRDCDSIWTRGLMIPHNTVQ